MRRKKQKDNLINETSNIKTINKKSCKKKNEMPKISQEKKILEAVVKTLGNCDRIKIKHVSEKKSTNQ